MISHFLNNFIIHEKIVFMFRKLPLRNCSNRFDKQAKAIMKMQLEGEKKTMKEMMEATEDQALLEIAEAERKAKTCQPGTHQNNQDAVSQTINMLKQYCVKCRQ
ncbi:hypothetical protein SLE2022_090370 [Rubroshorea leprosula]